MTGQDHNSEHARQERNARLKAGFDAEIQALPSSEMALRFAIDVLASNAMVVATLITDRRYNSDDAILLSDLAFCMGLSFEFINDLVTKYRT